MKTRNPLHLTEKPVTITHFPKGGKVCALVETDPAARPHNTYAIHYFDAFARAMFERSPFYGLIPYWMFELGLYVHEVSHVIKGTMDIDVPITNWIIEYIDNVLADDADEYNLMKLFPDYARYTQLVLASLKWDTPASIAGTSIEQHLHTLFFLARFGVVMAGADADFVSFILPLVLSSRRGKRENTIVAALAIYEYLYQKDRQTESGRDGWQAAMGTVWQQQAPLSADDLAQLVAGMQIVSSGAMDAAQQAAQPSPSSGMFAGTSGPPPDDSEKDDEFFTATCGMHARTIIELEHVFLLRKQAVSRVYAPEGELHPRRRRQAVKDVVAGEERRNYSGLQRLLPSLDLVILQDVSGSTDDLKTPYARATVCFLAALEKKEGVRAGLVTFNSDYRVLMQLGDPVSKTRIRPYAGGGTTLFPALREIVGWEWKAKERIIFILTDGYISGWSEQCVPYLYENFVSQGFGVYVVEIVEDENQTEVSGEARDFPGSFASTIAHLPAGLMQCMTGGVV